MKFDLSKADTPNPHSYWVWLAHCINNSAACRKIYDEHTDLDQLIVDIRRAWNSRHE